LDGLQSDTDRSRSPAVAKTEFRSEVGVSSTANVARFRAWILGSVARALRADRANLSASRVYTAPLEVNLVIRRMNSRAVMKTDSRERFIIGYLILGNLGQCNVAYFNCLLNIPVVIRFYYELAAATISCLRRGPD
jgi:hypothetical protein